MSCLTGEWTRETTLLLIDKYKEKRPLWDPTDPGYFSHRNKAVLWEELASEVNMTTDETRRRMQSLLASMRRERIRVRRCLKDDGVVYKSTWFAYDKMSFLLDRPFPPTTTYYKIPEPDKENLSAASLKKKRGQMRVALTVQCNEFEGILKDCCKSNNIIEKAEDIEMNYRFLEQRAQTLKEINEILMKKMIEENDLAGLAQENDYNDDHYLDRFIKLKAMKDKILVQIKSNECDKVPKREIEELDDDRCQAQIELNSEDESNLNIEDFASRLCETTMTTLDRPSTSRDPLFGFNFFKIEDDYASCHKQSKEKKRHIEDIPTSCITSNGSNVKRKKIGLTIKPSAELMEQPSDDCSSFGQYISDKLRQYSMKTRCAVQHAICEIIFSADQGRLDTYCEVFPDRKNKDSNQVTNDKSESRGPDEGCETDVILGS